MKHILIIVSFLIVSIYLNAQEMFAVAALEDTRNSNGYYTSISYAAKNPLDVKTLDIQKSDVDTFFTSVEKYINLENLLIHFASKTVNYKPIVSILQLKNIEIYHSDCQLYLPNNLFIGSNIKTVKIMSSLLPNIPESILTNKNIEKVILYKNIISKIPDIIPIDNSLKILSLKSNSLKKLPASFSNLKKLEFLNISINHFDSIPESIFALSNLKVLNIGFNPIQVLPSKISKLKKLETLYLTETKITSLPIEIKKMKNLHFIFMTDTYLTAEQKQQIIKSLPKRCVINWTSEDFFHTLDN